MVDRLSSSDEDQFDAFVRDQGRRLQLSLIAAHGPTVGNEAAQKALVYCWEHWARVRGMANPTGYLFRVGQNAARQEYRPKMVAPADEPTLLPDFEPGLERALAGLTDHQRVAVLLVHGHGYRLAEAAEIFEITVSTLRNHLRRGLDKLRQDLGVDNEPV